MPKEKTKGITIKRETAFQGKRCVGLDSGAIASLICHEKAFQEYGDVLKNSLFKFTHDECVGRQEINVEDSEVFKILTKRYNLNEEDAKTKIQNFLGEYKIDVIPKGKKNANLVVYLYREGKKKGIEVHPPDVWIIADFKSCGVNLVYSNNEHFRKLCSLLGISTPYFPTDEKQTVDKRFFELFGKRKFRK